MEIALAVSFLLLLALTFLATVDMAFGQLSDVGLRRLAAEAEEHPKARYAPLLNEILENRSRFSFTLSAAIQILLVAFTVLVTFVSLRWFSRAAVGLIVSLAVTLVLAAIFRQFIPRLISLRNPESKLLRLLPWVAPFYRALSFAAEPWHRSFDRMRKDDVEEDVSEEDEEDNGDDIEALIDVGEAEGIIEEEERELIQSAIEFGDTRVSEVMTPRTEIVALPNDATVRQARDMIIESRTRACLSIAIRSTTSRASFTSATCCRCWPSANRIRRSRLLFGPFSLFLRPSRSTSCCRKCRRRARTSRS